MNGENGRSPPNRHVQPTVLWNDVATYEVSFVKDDGITIYIKIGEAERREFTEDEISAGKVTGILSGTTVIFTAQPIDGYDLYYQVTSDDGTLNPLGMCMMTVTEDSSVAFTKVQQKYTITWKSQDGKTILETDSEVLYGTTLSPIAMIRRMLDTGSTSQVTSLS